MESVLQQRWNIFQCIHLCHWALGSFVNVTWRALFSIRILVNIFQALAPQGGVGTSSSCLPTRSFVSLESWWCSAGEQVAQHDLQLCLVLLLFCLSNHLNTCRKLEEHATAGTDRNLSLKVHKHAPEQTQAHLVERLYGTMVSYMYIQKLAVSPYDFIQWRTHGSGYPIFNKQRNQNRTKRGCELLIYIYSVLSFTAEAEIMGCILRDDWSGFMLHHLVFKQHTRGMESGWWPSCVLHIFRTRNSKGTLWSSMCPLAIWSLKPVNDRLQCFVLQVSRPFLIMAKNSSKLNDKYILTGIQNNK